MEREITDEDKENILELSITMSKKALRVLGFAKKEIKEIPEEDDEDIKYDYNTLCHIHRLVADKLVLEQELGRIRTTPVNIGGTKWKPQFPIESQIKEDLEKLLNQPLKTKTEIAIEIMLSVMRRQMFIDGNKRVAMLFANKIMIDNGCGIITIDQDHQEIFYEKLIKYYESGDMVDLKQWIYEYCIDGIDLNNH